MRPRRVAVLVETSGNYGREILRGVAAWAREHADWQLTIECGDATTTSLLPGWSGDGIICRARGPALAAAVEACEVPRIMLGRPDQPRRGRAPQVGIPGWDATGLAEQAIAHLRAKGFRSFAFCCHPEFGDYGRAEPFRRLAGGEVPVWHPPRRGDRRAALRRWLERLPRPCGIWAANDVTGMLLLEACHGLGLAIPGDLAVLGCDDDAFLCELAHPTLSSVAPPTYALGCLAAERLDALMDGRPCPAQEMPPIRVVPRASTEWTASADPLAAAAAARIAAAPPGTTMAAIARSLGVSVRSLERRLRGATGLTPGRLARSRRLAEAQRLLASSDLSAAAVAERTGYASPSRMAEAFTRATGMPPGAWRRLHRSA